LYSEDVADAIIVPVIVALINPSYWFGFGWLAASCFGGYGRGSHIRLVGLSVGRSSSSFSG
jgi:hypothetical protein